MLGDGLVRKFSDGRNNSHSSSMALMGCRIWILLATTLTVGGWFLSLIGMLTFWGNCLFLFVFGLGFWLWKPALPRMRFHLASLKRFCRPFPLLFLILFLMQAVGGLLYAPTNYDGLTYRVPRILHWLEEHRWHWIGGWNARMDYSALGYEWLMAPLLAITRSDRLLFLPNLISFAFLPSLVFSAFRELGIAVRVARYWMWILPCGYSLVLQAGSIGNDSFALVFLLAAIAFARRSARADSAADACIALLSMALLTGAKASNLPLLLPCLLAFIPALRVVTARRSRIVGTLFVCVIALSVSFVPLAVINFQKTGDWTGDPLNDGKMKLRNSVAGIVGNVLQLTAENVEPPIIVGTSRINSKIAEWMQTPNIQKLTADFPRLSLSVNDLASEEAAGIGLGITLLGTILVFASLTHPRAFLDLWKSSASARTGILVSVAGWLSIAVLMAKLGSEAAPRIATPYYALLLVLPSLHPLASKLVGQKSWLVFSFLAAASVLPAVILSPARPLFPVGTLVAFLERRSPDSPMANRVKTVYEVYARRSDPHAQVREQLPPGTRKIGFAGTADESEISFWRPFGERSVRDLVPTEPDKLPDVAGLDAIVTSDWGCNDRYGKTSEELAAVIGWSINQTITVRSRAGSSPRTWSILAPTTFGTTSE